MRLAPSPPRPEQEQRASRAEEHAPLFRPEALSEQRTRWLGTVLMAPRTPQSLAVGFALAAAASVAALLIVGEYTRKARVTGWLVADPGLVRVFAPQTGVVAALHAREGQAVRSGQPLLVLSTELRSEALGATRTEVARRLRERRDSMSATRVQTGQLQAQQREDGAVRLDALRAEIGHVGREVALQQDRLTLAEEGVDRQRHLRRMDLGTVQRLQREDEGRLDEAVRLQGLERLRAGLERERLQLEAELRGLPLTHQLALAEMDRAIATLEQELAEAESRREVVLTAPHNGTVTAVQAALGSGVGITTPLLGIVPEGATLEAQLFAPSRAVGFLREGQEVLLRYAAFPYQEFGHHRGRVASISRSAIGPAELPQQLSGLQSLRDAAEPLYRIAVRLEAQAVTAYGTEVPLQPGMQFEADVLVETRRLFEWVLDPLYTLTGRWQ